MTPDGDDRIISTTLAFILLMALLVVIAAIVVGIGAAVHYGIL